MTRAPKTCASPNCPNTQPCPHHAPKPWQTSRRSDRTISGSRQQRRAARILHRHDHVCHVCGKDGADTVDHVIPLAEGGRDDDTNLRPIHSEPCHRQKTQAEALRARGLDAR